MFEDSACLWFLIVSLIVFLAIGYVGSPLWVWSLAILAFLYLCKLPIYLLVLVGILLLVFNIPQIRRLLISNWILKFFQVKKIMPAISETERIALEAGSVWMDAELFSGKPNFKNILSQPYPKLNSEEQDFIDKKVSEVCKIASDWEIYQRQDLPPAMWEYLKKEKFFGMIVSKEYGGLGFSATANSAVVQKLASHSIPLCICVMVPNSLGPAELIAHYGTQAQKDHYLPRLADGREIPCFGLTEPNAGSDAGSIDSYGVLFKDSDGSIKIRLNWEKRYISLAAISTIIGLAIKLKDPDNLLGKGEDLGITCVLVPSNTPGVKLGKRHNPMGVPFYNCPIVGKDVVLPIDQIIGGVEGAGQGWRMLMECLAAGRAISLPALATGGVKFGFRTTSAYANIRKQFGMELSRFEGIEEPLARISGITYMLEALRTYTCGALVAGAKPAVVSAIAKYISTELSRIVNNDSMDILGGAGISRGPRNTIAHAYLAAPIGITVEGANILTRTMIIFGQGAIRCHPFAYNEVKAVNANDGQAFDKAFWGHIGFIVRNTIRAKLLFLTRGYLACTSEAPFARNYVRKIAWSSAVFSILTDIAMGTYGGSLKMREKITGRFADALTWMYMAIAILRKFKNDGCPQAQRPLFDWAMKYSLHQVNLAFAGIFQNYNVPLVKYAFRIQGFFHRLNPIAKSPEDRLGHNVVKLISTDMLVRDQLTDGIFVSSDPESAIGRYEKTLKLCMEAKEINKVIRKAIKAKALPKKKVSALIGLAQEKGVITAEQAKILEHAETARNDAVMVDSFDLKDFSANMLS